MSGVRIETLKKNRDNVDSNFNQQVENQNVDANNFRKAFDVEYSSYDTSDAEIINILKNAQAEIAQSQKKELRDLKIEYDDNMNIFKQDFDEGSTINSQNADNTVGEGNYVQPADSARAAFNTESNMLEAEANTTEAEKAEGDQKSSEVDSIYGLG